MSQIFFWQKTNVTDPLQGQHAHLAEKLVACPECDLLMHKPRPTVGTRAQCVRCGYTLAVARPKVAERSLALVLAALMLFVPANFLPIMHLSLLGRRAEETVWSGVLGLYQSGMFGVAAIVFLCSLLIPLLKLLCQLAVLMSIMTARQRRAGILLYRIYHHLRDWGMLEIYLLGILVSIIKLKGMANLELGVGLLCFVGVMFVQLWLELVMSPQQIWEALSVEQDARD